MSLPYMGIKSNLCGRSWKYKKNYGCKTNFSQNQFSLIINHIIDTERNGWLSIVFIKTYYFISDFIWKTTEKQRIIKKLGIVKIMSLF